MRSVYAVLVVLLFAACPEMTRMEQAYEKQNSGFSPNYNPGKVYTLAMLPPTGARHEDAANLNGLYDFAGMTMLQTGHFTPVERSRIDAVLKEQEFGASGVVDQSTAARIGKVLGADAVMMLNIASTKHDPFFDDSPNQRETELYVKIISSSTAEVLYYGRGQGSSFEGTLSAWQAAFQLAVGALKSK
jgi:hypothetical protein